MNLLWDLVKRIQCLHGWKQKRRISWMIKGYWYTYKHTAVINWKNRCGKRLWVRDLLLLDISKVNPKLNVSCNPIRPHESLRSACVCDLQLPPSSMLFSNRNHNNNNNNNAKLLLVLTHFRESPTLSIFINLFNCQRKICVMSTSPGDQWWSTERRKNVASLTLICHSISRCQPHRLHPTAFSCALYLYFSINCDCGAYLFTTHPC